MSRRTFLRWLFALAAAAAASLTGINYFLKTFAGKVSKSGDSGGTEAVRAANAVDDGTLLSFLILSDMHLNADLPERAEHLRKTFDEIPHFEGRVDGIVFTGDITDYGRAKDYKELQTILKAYPKLPPYFANMGNHDYYDIWMDNTGNFNREAMPNGKTDARSREAFMRFFHLNKPYSSADINGFKLIMLSQETYVQEKPEVSEGAWYSDEQLDWLQTRLAEVKDGRPIFIMIHQPLPPAGQDGGAHQLMRAKEFRRIAKPYPNVFVFSGHTHQDFNNGLSHYVKETFHWFHNSSLGRVVNRNNPDAAKTLAQGLYVQVYPDRVAVRGREFSIGKWIKEADWSVPLKQAAV